MTGVPEMDILRIAVHVAARCADSHSDLIQELSLDALPIAQEAVEFLGEEDVKHIVFDAFNRAFDLGIEDRDSWSFNSMDELSLEEMFHELGHQIADPGFFKGSRSKSLMEGELGEDVARGYGNPEGDTGLWELISESSGIDVRRKIPRADFEKLVQWMKEDAGKATGHFQYVLKKFVQRVVREAGGDDPVDMLSMSKTVDPQRDAPFEQSEETGRMERRFHLLLKHGITKALKSHLAQYEDGSEDG